MFINHTIQLTNYGYNIIMVIKSHLVSLLKTLPFSWYGLIGTDHRAVENWKEIGVGIQKDKEWPESGDKN